MMTEAQTVPTQIRKRMTIETVGSCPTCGAPVPAGFRFCGQCGRALAAALAPVPGDQVTIAFTDLEGYSAFASEAQRDEVRELILDYHALVREQVSRRGGFEVKQTGDGFMIAFASAAKAVQFAVDLQREMREHRHPHRLQVSIGLNSGDAIREGGDFFGHTVNVASRIADWATGGQVLASASTRELAGTIEGVTFVDAGRPRFRGLPGRYHLYEVRWE